MLAIRRADARGLADLGWLNSRHTFSFGEYHDPRFMGFGPLRVINEDRVQAGRGFGTHGHRNMEIISYVLEGALEHEDSIGTGSVLRPGDVQRMSAGTGVRHSEFNHSTTHSVHFLQIWIVPEADGLSPSYEQKTYSNAQKQGRLCLLGSRDGRDASLTIHQDVSLYATLLADNDQVTHDLGAQRKGWVQVARGTVTVNGEPLHTGDGVAIAAPGAIAIAGTSDAEVLLFDMGQE